MENCLCSLANTQKSELGETQSRGTNCRGSGSELHPGSLTAGLGGTVCEVHQRVGQHPADSCNFTLAPSAGILTKNEKEILLFVCLWSFMHIFY